MFRSMFSRRALLAVAIVNRRTVSSVPLQSSRRWLHSSLSRFEAPGFVDETTRSEMTHTGRVHKPEHLDKASSADGRYGFATVMDILKWKTDRNQPQLISTSSNTNVLVSLQKMHKNNVGALIITHPETDAMVGIITASDYRRLRDDKQTHSLTVADVMTDARDTITCLPTTSLMRCISLMEDKLASEPKCVSSVLDSQYSRNDQKTTCTSSRPCIDSANPHLSPLTHTCDVREQRTTCTTSRSLRRTAAPFQRPLAELMTHSVQSLLHYKLNPICWLVLHMPANMLGMHEHGKERHGNVGGDY
eukprot:jgi/Mesvir1/29196/Mv16247-RA.1